MLPANLLQGQRDYFGAHTFARVDKSAGKMYHVEWSQRRQANRQSIRKHKPHQLMWFFLPKILIMLHKFTTIEREQWQN